MIPVKKNKLAPIPGAPTDPVSGAMLLDTAPNYAYGGIPLNKPQARTDMVSEGRDPLVDQLISAILKAPGKAPVPEQAGAQLSGDEQDIIDAVLGTGVPPGSYNVYGPSKMK